MKIIDLVIKERGVRALGELSVHQTVPFHLRGGDGLGGSSNEDTTSEGSDTRV